LRAEVSSERFRDRLLALLERDGVDPSVIERPDLADAEATAYRLALLGEHRGWGRDEGMFGAFPTDVEWFGAALSPVEVLAVLYIDWDWWLHLSGGTRRPTDAAERIRAGLVPGVDVESHEPLARALRSRQPPPELIVVTLPDRSRLVLVEGHWRLTAYALFPDYLPQELEIFLGVAEGVDRWGLFGTGAVNESS
jgi:hypothetical protein